MHDIMMTAITAIIPVVMSVIGYLMAKYIKTPSQLKTIENLVNAAVVFAEKTGAVQQLTGSQQFKLAYNFVQDKAKQLGITQLDEELIKTLIEQSWANQRQHLSSVYDAGKKQADADSLEVEKARLANVEAQLEQEKQAIEKERKELKSAVEDIQGTLNKDQSDTVKDPADNTKDSNPNNEAGSVTQ